MDNYFDCPACGGLGFDGLDEDGRAYTCYACGETGRMTEEVYKGYMFGVNEDPEYYKLKPLFYTSCDEYGDCYDLKRKIFYWARPERPARVSYDFDDVPF
jgi:hypothetical protein